MRRRARLGRAMLDLLRTIPFLADADDAALELCAKEANWFSLPGGVALFQAEEPTDMLYFLVSGALAAFRLGRSGDGTRLLGYIRPGEPVGEMALISGEPHTGSVYAVRDSQLIGIPRAIFSQVAHAHPALMARLARLALARSRQRPSLRPRAEPRIYALIATSPTIDLRLRARILAEQLEKLGRRVRIVEAEEGDLMDPSAFDSLERDNDIVFLTAAIGDTNWFRTCLRQADRLWVLARADARPSIPLLSDDPSPARQFRFVDVVLLHHGADRRETSAEAWRTACDAARIFHWDGLNDRHAARLARTISGKAVALVLSGGGARAYAALGVIRALREAAVPIDMVGGTSMGGLVAACFAMGWSDDEMEVRIRKAFVESNPLGDYVLPVVALSRGKRVDDRLLEHFGDALIEDLQVPYFCVSTNLMNSSVRLHRQGLLRKAVRASISLPGILPPVVDGEDGLLVDGAVLKNFPVDVMAQMHRGPIIGVDVARPTPLNLTDYINPPSFFGWVARHGFQSPPPIGTLLMRAATISVDPWQGRERTDVLIVPEMPNVDLRDWKMFDEAVAAGYEAAVSALKRAPPLTGDSHAARDDPDFSPDEAARDLVSAEG
jgi:NTE family protein